MRSYSEKTRDRIEQKWQRLKLKARPCPNCGNKAVGLNDSFMHRFNRFWLECESCHWCGRSKPTIKMAIKAWNVDYMKMLRDAYMNVI